MSYTGTFANEVIKNELAFTSLHPIQKFVVLGSKAKELAIKYTADSFAYEMFRYYIIN